jgi:hypothetical protein
MEIRVDTSGDNLEGPTLDTRDHRRPAPMTAPTRSTSDSDLVKVA